ncbi:hypothetical protein QTN25_006217 [Entamoeba marina]
MKINPIFDYDENLFSEDGYCKQMLSLFPNIQTLQIHDLSYHISQDVLSQISYIRTQDKLFLFKENTISNKLDANMGSYYKTQQGTTFKSGLKNNKISRHDNVDSYGYYFADTIGSELFKNKNKQIIEKLEELFAHSFKTANFLQQHHKWFTSLKKLSIVTEIEHTSVNAINTNNYNMDIFCILPKIKSLRTVQVHSPCSCLDSYYITFIKNFIFLKFNIVFYSYNENYNDHYLSLLSLNNVQIMFGCFSPQLLIQDFHVPMFLYNENKINFEMISFPESESVNSLGLNSIFNSFNKLLCFPNIIHINHFEMLFKHDISNISTKQLLIKFYSISSFDFIFPSTLTSLDLTIHDTIVDSNNTPKLFLNNAALNNLCLNGFKYDSLKNLNIGRLPTKCSFINCSNMCLNIANEEYCDLDYCQSMIFSNCHALSIKSIFEISLEELSIEYCSDMVLEAERSSFIVTEEKIVINSVNTAKLYEKKCSNYIFNNIVNLYLKVPSQFCNIQFPINMETLFFNATPNNSNCSLTNLGVIKSFDLLKSCPLSYINFENLHNQVISLPTTLMTLQMNYCKNLVLQTNKEIQIFVSSFQNNSKCVFKNISIRSTVNSWLALALDGCEIKYNDSIFYGYYDVDDLSEEELLKHLKKINNHR